MTSQNNEKLLQQVREHIKKYSKADDAEAKMTLVRTFVPFLIAVTLYKLGFVPLPLFFVFMAGYHMRLFILFHDMAHNSFFSNPAMNSQIGYLFGALSWTSFARWRSRHNNHHSISGQLGIYDNGQTILLTKQQYEVLPLWKKIAFRILRDPIVFFTFVAPLQQCFYNPLIVGDAMTRLGWIVQVYCEYQIHPLFPLESCIAASFGFILFHLQHAVNVGYKRYKENWNLEEASIRGSTMLYIPPVMRWATLGIEYHHIHHFSTQVPCYKLQKCHDEAPQGLWKMVTFVDAKKTWESMGNSLYDENTQQYITF